MKKISLLLICLTAFPALSFAQISASSINAGNVLLKITEATYGLKEKRISGIFEESFEGYIDFSTDMSPWTMLDVDEKPTWGIENISFLHQYEPMSFIVFNPSATTPAMVNPGIMPHEGSRFAACFSANGTKNNDWLISPALATGTGTSVSFYVKSYTSQFGLERYKVGISTTDTRPESFTIISGTNYLTAPAAAWDQKNFNLEAFDGETIYIAIQCVSDEAFIFMVDDFRFSTQLPDVSAIGGQVTNALTGQAIPGAEVCIAGLCTFTDQNGNYSIGQVSSGSLVPAFGATPVYGNVPLTVQFNDQSTENTHTVSCSKQEYLTYVNEQVSLSPGDTLNLNLSLSPELQQGNVRFVLNWGATPTDLDSHLLTPEIEGNEYHVFFDNKGNAATAPFARLDFDITTGFGPETMTIYELRPGNYSYYVRNFSENPSITLSHAVVQIYGVDGLRYTVQVPSSGNGNYWHVCDINGLTGDIILKNNIVTEPPPRLFNILSDKSHAEMHGNRYINSWLWDFGDGYISTLKNPLHTYSDEGSYTVSLKVDNGINQESLVKEAYIQVGSQSIEENCIDNQVDISVSSDSDVMNVVSSGEIFNLRIVGISGRVFLNKSYSGTEISLNIGFLLKGIYLIEIETNAGSFVRKFSKW